MKSCIGTKTTCYTGVYSAATVKTRSNKFRWRIVTFLTFSILVNRFQNFLIFFSTFELQSIFTYKYSHEHHKHARMGLFSFYILQIPFINRPLNIIWILQEKNIYQLKDNEIWWLNYVLIGQLYFMLIVLFTKRHFSFFCSRILSTTKNYINGNNIL